jgi:hypothetical protein
MENLERKRLERAIQQLTNRRQSEGDDRNGSLADQLGNLHWKLGMREEAIHWYLEAVRHAIEGENALRARAILRHLVRIDPGNEAASAFVEELRRRWGISLGDDVLC